MSVGASRLRTTGVFLLGFSLGVFTLSLFTAFNDVSELSLPPSLSSLQAAPSNNYNHGRLLTVMDYTDPSTISEKDILMTDNGSPPQQEMLQQEMLQPQLEMPLPQIEGDHQAHIRHVHVGTMCRCASGILPTIGPIVTDEARDTQILQPPSLATGMHAKHFIQHPSATGCSCMKDTNLRVPYASTTTDLFLKKMKLHECPHVFPAKYEWENMPDLGVEETLPLFLGVQSYESPLSLNGTLHNWLDHDLFRRINARDVFVQLNHRSLMDDRIMFDFHDHMAKMQRQSPITVLGSDSSSNLHPGRTISNMCRRAESHPDSHPNGENLLLFLEKDWNLYNGANDVPSKGQSLERLFRGINALAQRGVPYIRLKRKSKEVSKSKTWPCPSQGFPFECTTAHQHRWTNQPMVVSCKWFLRYLEPFALLDDPIMYGCREGFQENRYCDWEEALQDGRIAWVNSQWVVANVITGNHRVFFHQEVDQ